MMKTQHTPGTWSYEKSRSGNWFDIKPKGRERAFAGCYGDEAEANARLVAAAPDMLDGNIGIKKIITGAELGKMTPEMAITLIKVIVEARIESATGLPIEEVLS